MPTPTTRLRAIKIDAGSELNTWGAKLNSQAIDLIDEAVAGVERITLSASTYALTSANYTTDQARNAALIFQGSPAASVAVTIPAVEKTYVVVNDTAQTVTLGCGGDLATLAAGDRAVVWCDGTDCGLGSISAQTVNGLILAASLAPGTLPGQTGNAGKFLSTDGTAPSWTEVPNPDVGGGADATVTASTALTSSSSVVQSANMSGAAQSITLPDATTLTEGGRKHVIVNAGNRTFGVRSNGGALLTVVPAGAVAELHLYDNGTAAGGWGVTGRGLEPALTLVDHTAPTTIVTANEVVCRLTDTLSLHFGQTSGPNLYALAVDSTPGAAAAGTWTLVSNNASIYHAFRISDTQAILFFTQGQYAAAVVTVSGTTITVGATASTATAFLAQVTFTGRPVLAQLTASLYVALYGDGANVMAISVSGTTVTIGSGVASGATTAQQGLAVYRVSDTTALALYIDNSGTAGSPYSIRGVVLSVSGTTVTVGTSAGVNDTIETGKVATAQACQLSATKYVVGWARPSPDGANAAAFTVSGTSVSVGSVLQVEAANTDATMGNWNRFQPDLYRLSDSTALFTFLYTGTASRHVVLTESGGSLTKGTILYSLWSAATGGNFPQTASGFLAFSTDANEMAVFGVTVNGTSLDVSGTFEDEAFMPMAAAASRFGLSGGVYAIGQGGVTNFSRRALMHLFRFVPNAPPRYLGPLRLNNVDLVNGGTQTPVEVAANKVAVIGAMGMTQPAATGNSVRLLVVEFASA